MLCVAPTPARHRLDRLGVRPPICRCQWESPSSFEQLAGDDGHWIQRLMREGLNGCGSGLPVDRRLHGHVGQSEFEYRVSSPIAVGPEAPREHQRQWLFAVAVRCSRPRRANPAVLPENVPAMFGPRFRRHRWRGASYARLSTSSEVLTMVCTFQARRSGSHKDYRPFTWISGSAQITGGASCADHCW